VELRLPHPQGRRPTSVTGGKYNPDTETVTVEPSTDAPKSFWASGNGNHD